MWIFFSESYTSARTTIFPQALKELDEENNKKKFTEEKDDGPPPKLSKESDVGSVKRNKR